MAYLEINITEIKNNIRKISTYLNKHNIHWSLITKVFSGDKDFMSKILTPDIVKDLHSVGDSRLSSLKNLKELNPDLVTIYIKPPAMAHLEDIVRYADISTNTSLKTIKALNEIAKKQEKIHKVLVMIELGELREGVNRDDFAEFYKNIFNLSHIEVVGIGSNLGCMYGIEPTYDKLLQLILYKELTELKHGDKLPLLSGGSSITLPMIESTSIPKGINHFRIGEAAFFGTSPLENNQFLDLCTDTFNFYTQIIELEEKDIVPDGIISEGNVGHSAEFSEEDNSRKSYKAILDFGLLDVDQEGLTSDDKNIKLVGITSDMTVLDIGNNRNEDKIKKYKVGDHLCLDPSYLAVARLLSSKFIEKVFIEE